MANAFQEMLERFGLTNRILALNADNATSNDTQTAKLDKLNNSFSKDNRVRCFNHTIQLSAKALLQPFNTALSGKSTDDEDVILDNHNDLLGNETEGDEDEDEDEGADDIDDEDDDIDELQELGEDEQKQVLEETATVRETVTKVSLQS
jgi:hypothetical protein